MAELMSSAGFERQVLFNLQVLSTRTGLIHLGRLKRHRNRQRRSQILLLFTDCPGEIPPEKSMSVGESPDATEQRKEIRIVQNCIGR